MQFTIDDIQNKERLTRMIRKEAESIFSSESARKGRSLEDIEFTVSQGKTAELYLIENCGYKEADKKWHDLVDDEGIYTEVKAYSNVYSKDATFIQRDLHRYRTSSWNVSKWYILFKYENGIYTLIEKIRI